MTLPLWGQLEKAQDDPQTIEEAIEAAILAHEADPTAHLGEGESLSEHKHETVIDHPAGSVVADKFSPRDFVFIVPFINNDMVTGDVNVTYPTLNWSANWDGGPYYVYGAAPVGTPIFTLSSAEIIWRLNVFAENYGEDSFMYWGPHAWVLGDVEDTRGPVGAAFGIKEGRLIARAAKAGITPESAFAYAIEVDCGEWDNPSGYRTYEVHWYPLEEIFRFFINDTQVAAIDVSAYSAIPLPLYFGFSQHSPDEENQGFGSAQSPFFAATPP